jgi:hypothetical protein
VLPEAIIPGPIAPIPIPWCCIICAVPCVNIAENAAASPIAAAKPAIIPKPNILLVTSWKIGIYLYI